MCVSACLRAFPLHRVPVSVWTRRVIMSGRGRAANTNVTLSVCAAGALDVWPARHPRGATHPGCSPGPASLQPEHGNAAYTQPCSSSSTVAVAAGAARHRKRRKRGSIHSAS